MMTMTVTMNRRRNKRRIGEMMLQWSSNGGESRTPRLWLWWWRRVKGCIYNARAPFNRRVVITHVDLPIKRSTPRPLIHSTSPTPGKLIEFLARCNITSAEERTQHTHIFPHCVSGRSTRGTRRHYIISIYIYIYQKGGQDFRIHRPA